MGLGVVVAAMAILVTGVGIWVLSVRADTPPLDQLKPVKEGSNSVVFAADGSRLGYIQSDTIRHPVSAKKIPQLLDHATVAIEDEHFYEHEGIDYGAIVRAGWEDLKAGEAVQGGSTITQQLVRNLYIADPEETIERKIREATWAEEYEQEYSKTQILTKYLNTASYGTTDGRTAVGVQAAAETYFSKPVTALDLPEAALIAGLPQAPSEYNPFLNPKGAVERRNDVLRAMAKQGYITHSEYEQALQAGLELDRGHKYETIREPYFFDYVTQELIDKYGVNTVRNGGLKVYTTINPTLQAAAHRAILSHWSDPSGPASALVSIDPSNGHIVAMASSGSFATSQFNLAAEGHRQAGSSFKPFVLTAAVRQGMDPDTTYYSGRAPVTLKLDDGITTWTVNNAEGSGGTMSVRDATVHSVNAVFAQLDLDVGPDEVRQTAYDMGITTHLDGFPAEGIGGLRIGVTPLEMSNAYATLASGGIRNTATAISKVEFPNGDTDVPTEEERTRAFSDGIAYEVTDVLKGVITSGTGTAASIGCEGEAGKTGTTDDYTDAWFVGYTPKFSTAVWVGYPDARTSMGSGAYGGTYAAPVWHDYMLAAQGKDCPDFPAPENPVDFSSWSGSHAVSARSTTPGYGGTVKPGPPSAVRPSAPSNGTQPSGGANGQYPPDLYAPGAGQGPAPAPGGGGGHPGGPRGGGGTGGAP
ncbi:MAG TPA: transglycosylase domain-containing protein [Solirubrobacterales bacterium]|nr:transglycosylase domain-containing protein [Solirubrobacterales bacterium]